ncbi:MAG: S53 family peptidase [Solirubrobacteraceae bacterium]
MQRGSMLGASIALVLSLVAAPSALAHRVSRHHARSSRTIAQLTVGPDVAHVAGQPPTSAQCAAATGGAVMACYGPPDIRNQYDFGPLYAAGDTGSGQTIVIFDSFGSPTIRQDLATFDSTYNIPAPPAFNIYEPEGHVTYNYTHVPSPVDFHNKNVSTEIGWAYETTLDVEWAHAMAPGASIALVVTPNAETEGVQGLQNLQNAQRWALAHHIGTVWSNSFAATEQSFHNAATLNRLNSLYAQAAASGVTAFFASGDSGVANVNKQGATYPFPTVNFPTSSPDVVSVGGTEIPNPPPAISSYQPESVWNDCCGAGGGGFSAVFGEPGFQSAAGIDDPSGMRGVPDVSYNAALVSSILIWESFDPTTSPGWVIIGGTSAATPQWAALDAIANQTDGSLGFLAPRLYQVYTDGSYASAFHDVTAGDNGWAQITGYSAASGWDPATGLGTPDAYNLVQALKATSPAP